MKFTRGNSAAISLALVLMTLVTATTITSMPITRAQGQGPPPPGLLKGPPVHVGNPTGLSTGPPVPNCNAIDQGNFHGPPDDTRLGCK